MSSSINFCRTCGSEESESNPLQGIGKFQEIILLFTILVSQIGFFCNYCTNCKSINFQNASSLTSNVCEECLLSLKIIEKFADKCATADLFFIDLLKSLEDAKNADLKIEQLDKECLNQYTSDNSSNYSITQRSKKTFHQFHNPESLQVFKMKKIIILMFQKH